MTKGNHGWAVIRPDGSVDMLTVHEHRRGALVNWLHIHGVGMYISTTDEEIETLWKQYKGKYEVRSITAIIISDA